MFRIKGSIRNKLILFMLIATIVPIGTSIMITYAYNKESIKKNTIQENHNLLFQGKTNLIHYFTILDQVTLDSYTDARVFNILQSGYQNSQDQQNELFKAMQLISRSVNEILQVHLDIAKSNTHFLYSHERFVSAFKSSKDEAGTTAPFAGYQAYMEPTHLSNDYGINLYPKYDAVHVFTMHRPVYNVPDTERLGLLSVDIKLDFIDRIGKQLYNPDYENLYILNEESVIVYSNDAENWGQALKQEWVDYTRSLEGEQGSFEWDKDDFSGMVIFEKMETSYMNWILVKQIPYSHLYENARDLTRINVITFTLFLAIVIAATVFISIRFTSPIRQLIAAINKIQAGQLHVDIDVRGKDEIGVLARRFRLMMNTLNESILREYALNLANKTNELKALQAQINPHFLNNALQSIGTLALKHQEIRIYTLITSLGKMMRYHMNTDETVVPLKQEVDYVKGYLKLQEQRFDERLQMEFSIDPKAEAVMLPKMTLQPIVENFFKHGYDSTQGGRIRIECSLEQSSVLHIAVSDNGKGMDDQELAALQTKLKQGPSIGGEGSSGIGLMNVNSRIKLYFNELAHMNISHTEEGGLRVELFIPLKEGGDVD